MTVIVRELVIKTTVQETITGKQNKEKTQHLSRRKLANYCIKQMKKSSNEKLER